MIFYLNISIWYKCDESISIIFMLYSDCKVGLKPMFVDQQSFDYFSWKLMPPKSVWIYVISAIMLLWINLK